MYFQSLPFSSFYAFGIQLGPHIFCTVTHFFFFNFASLHQVDLKSIIKI